MLGRFLGAVILAGLLIGCNEGEAGPRLLSIRFLDEKEKDGVPQPKESILLTFSDPVDLPEGVVRRGIHPVPETHSLGRYELRRDARDAVNELRIVLGEFDVEFEPRGIHGEDPEATGLIVELDKIGVQDGITGRVLTGSFGPVDIARPRHPPAELVRAEWVDEDRRYTINADDQLRLTFDRKVHLADGIKSKDGQIPPDLFILPVDGDRFGEGAYLREDRAEPNVIVLIVGKNPRLISKGKFDPATAGVPGAPSGVAIQGTPIRPQPGIVDALGNGVVSRGVVDVTGDYEPFRAVDGFLEPNQAIYGHTVTSLRDGRVLITGGIVATLDARGGTTESPPQDAVWIFEPAATEGGEWRQVGRMKFPRIGHTATYMPGPDLTFDSKDDFVILAGGYDGQQPLNQLDYFHVRDSEVLPLANLPVLPSARFYHTAHVLPDSNHLVLVGGQHFSLNPTVERIEVELDPAKSSIVSTIAKLEAPRFLHRSILYERGGPPVILVWGGVGLPPDKEVQPLVPASVLNTKVLAAPEIVVNLELSRSETRLLIEAPGDSSPGVRRGHQLVLLGEERFDILLIGGTPEHPHPGYLIPMQQLPTPEQCVTAYRIELSLGADEPVIRYRAAGTLHQARYDFASAPLPFGHILVIGGNDGHGPIASVELYDPSTDSFQAFSEGLIAPRESPGLAAIHGHSRWLVIGGKNAVIRGATDSRTVLVEEYQSLD